MTKKVEVTDVVELEDGKFAIVKSIQAQFFKNGEFLEEPFNLIGNYKKLANISESTQMIELKSDEIFLGSFYITEPFLTGKEQYLHILKQKSGNIVLHNENGTIILPLEDAKKLGILLIQNS